MTWSRFDDAARKHPKAVMAGNEAWGFWCAAIMYSNQYGTDGFIPDGALATEVLPCPIPKAKAKALAERLCLARVHEGKPALFARDDDRGGYVVHDFLEWNPSKSDVESKRRTDRERKRIRMDSVETSERIPRGIPPDAPRNPEGRSVDSGGASPARGPAPAGARVPVLSRPVPAKPDEEDRSSSLDFTDSDNETPCPLDLVQRAKKHDVFSQMLSRMPGVEIIQLEAKAISFVSYWTIGAGMGKRRRHWMRKLREDLRTAHEKNQLPAPGMVEHLARIEEDSEPTPEQRERWAARRRDLDEQEAERGTA